MTEIKSRYVQSPSEVREWVRDMLDKQEQISDEAKAKLEEMNSSESESEASESVKLVHPSSPSSPSSNPV